MSRHSPQLYGCMGHSLSLKPINASVVTAGVLDLSVSIEVHSRARFADHKHYRLLPCIPIGTWHLAIVTEPRFNRDHFTVFR